MTPEQSAKSHVSVRNMLGGSILALLLLIGITVFGFFKQNQTRVTSEWVVHTQKVIASFQQLETQLYESVTAQRGFILTSQARHEEIFNRNYEHLNRTLTRAMKITHDNHYQQVKLDHIRVLISDLRVHYSLTIDYVKTNQKNKAIDLVNGGKGQKLVEQIKTIIQDMISHEEELLEKRLDNHDKVRKLSSTVVITSSLLAIIFIVAVLFMMYKEFKRRLKIQQQLAQASQIQEAVLKATPFALITTSREGAVTLFNPAAEKLLGYTESEVINKSASLWHIPEEVAAFSQKLSQRFGERVSINECMTYLAERNLIESDIWSMIRKDGSAFKASLTLSPLKDNEGEIYGYIGIAYDITKQLEHEEAIIMAREQALAGTKAKSEFLANMSHEIRTPMNAIMGMAELLLEADLSEEQRKYVEIFQRAGDSLLNIINDILDLSKIEAGHFELDRVPFKMSSVVQKSVEMIALKAHQKNIELAVDIEQDLNDHYLGDPNRIRQMLLNLLGNAVKFTKKGEIVLKIRGKSISETQHELTIEVQDTGIGMTPENVKRLFERFAQADSSITKEFGGTGLGLSITKRLSELMNGDIVVHSTHGIGSRFCVTITLEADQVSTDELPVVNLKDKKVLIVDDTRTNRLIVRKILEHLEADVFEAQDGESGLDLIREHKQKNDPFHMIFLDSRMPGIDGFSVAEKVYQDEALKGPIMMMLTSDNRPGDLLKARRLGLKSHLIKPVLKADLVEAISKALNQTEQTPSKAVIDQKVIEENKLRILLVDDNDENRLVIKSFIKNKPWKVDEAKNGLEALEGFKNQSYDIILMDMQMPLMDGYTATREIRKIEKESQSEAVPVLALTAFALKEEVDKSYAAGCNGHLSKPVSKANLIAAINHHTAEIEVLIDSDLADLIPDYLEGRHKELLNLKEALQEENYSLIQGIGHKLRGSAGSYGFSPLSDVGQELEENGKVQNKQNIEMALDKYHHYLKKIKISYK